MSLPPAFWDSSALIPLCASQPQTAGSRALYARFGLVIWWAAQAEVWSGLTRLKRMRIINHHQFAAAKQSALALIEDCYYVHESAGILSDACSLLELHPLSAADALQLSAALEVCRHNPSNYVFITGDIRLADAARKIGFSVEFV
jgi:predicted nucleic acid-binding protein